MSLLLYLAIGALAVVGILGLSTDVRAAARRLFPPRGHSPRTFPPRLALRTPRGPRTRRPCSTG